MSFLKRLFGGGASAGDSQPAVAAQTEHKGFTVRATPFKNGGEFQTCGVISKEIDGVVKEQKFIRADKFSSIDDASSVALRKGVQMINEQGERLFE
ncbi:hypothetical protein GA830_17530 [Mesorhizobium sp. NBSH29]|uniref:HlyU family transcriptional regulator n=1 Tax=Mesorhizobium sp. NBSH29 TaxID=2654249 RepID=UPI0018966F77|nr:HlyU family transcriptional regulator [Mesorhizobium sp. NBSH29]QPC88353.1 hypothetical protein GA830_17530 [Mesorhizobium sp. NBSH29]